jgi:glycine C-acetyltransferase
MTAAGFTLAGADHAIIPVMLGDAVVAQNFARELQKEGIYVTGFFFRWYQKARRVSAPRCLRRIP